MTTLAIHSDICQAPLIKPEPRSPISIRPATEMDMKFIDDLQKKHAKMVGFARTAELEGHIQKQRVLIAEDELKRPIGYCISKDKYMGREDCGNIVQLNVAPQKQRGLIGAELIKTVFQRVPWGVRLFCCWCAQDLAANHFWEAMGFVPLAFRAGARGRDHGGPRGRKEGRVHIFWQRRIREGDEGPGASPYWYPTETNNGAMKEARIVLPIPPGTHWSDAKPMVLPGLPGLPGAGVPGQEQNDAAKALEGDAPKPRKPRTRGPKPKAPAVRPNSISMGGLRFAPVAAPQAVEAKPPKPKRVKQKNDPKYVAAARELRDKYLEQVNSPGGESLLPASAGKYDVSRQLEAAPSELKQVPLLKAA
jgi:N-acetylglutamate synthase-like GNAT family acetyltransferase